MITHRRRLTLALALLLTLALPALTLAGSPAAPGTPGGDLGDAPDSSNHFGVAMTAYPAVAARYPTVFDSTTGVPEGPLHLNPTLNGWLGAGVTFETDADVLPDADGVRNIDPPTNTPNRDGRDDGVAPVSPTINLPTCGSTQFRYIVTGVAAPPAPTNYVNVWIDFNRDGDWADRFTCTTSTGLVLVVSEWAVRDQVVNVVAGSVVWATPVFNSLHATATPDHWMRITMAEGRATLDPVTGVADGRGPVNGYKYGETEDYLLRYNTTTQFGYNPL